MNRDPLNAEFEVLKKHSAEQRIEFERLLNYTNLILNTVRHLTAIYDGNVPAEISRARVFLNNAPFNIFKDEYTELIKESLVSNVTAK